MPSVLTTTIICKFPANQTPLVPGVHTFYRRCSSGATTQATCNCAVAVRVDDDVIVVDKCGPTRTGQATFPMTVKLYKNGELTPGTSVVRLANGLKYQVHLPTGSIVTIHQSYGNFLNVWMWAAGVEFGQTLGEWYSMLVKAEDSLYTGLRLKEGQVADQLVKPSVISCSCGGVEKSCAPNLPDTL
ncbi:hypothetical protein NP493_4675g00004 [Ridgeia piscesae]|uniref:Uncharacterized protein n=1 Tax=Ridgeia piscesae TaxID=27915 RepID=A0AAD9IYN1_RIDPI|nr:hypothetical protein NP493_4675g00004 [Ridgeia piscesae]